MAQKQFTFIAHKAKIHGFYIEPKNPKAIIVLVHGFGEHMGRYKESVIPPLLESGLVVVAYDNIGHGKSGGKRGHCPSYEALLDIMDTVLMKAMEINPKLPTFLYGHSMGGNLVLNYALRRKHRLNGIVSTSPYLRLAFKPPKWKMVLGKIMLRLLPSITLPSGLDPNGISRISEEVEKYRQDPLVHDKVSPMYSFPIMDAGEWAIANASRLTVNSILLHGTGDLIIDYRGTQEFHQNASTTKLQLFERAFHELHHDLCRDEVVQIIQNWLQQQL